MLTKLIPEQIASYWDIIKEAVEKSLPPKVVEDQDNMNRILESLLLGNAQCWVSHRYNGNSKVLEVILTTQIIYDSMTNTKSLLIYSIYGYGKSPNSSWIDGLKTLVKYAYANNCVQIIAYSNVEKIKKLVSRLGGDASYSFLTLPIRKEK